jgi:hypothetical protein
MYQIRLEFIHNISNKYRTVVYYGSIEKFFLLAEKVNKNRKNVAV